MSEFDSLEARWSWSTAASTIERLRSLADDLEALSAGQVAEHVIPLITSWSFATRLLLAWWETPLAIPKSMTGGACSPAKSIMSIPVAA